MFIKKKEKSCSEFLWWAQAFTEARHIHRGCARAAEIPIKVIKDFLWLCFCASVVWGHWYIIMFIQDVCNTASFMAAAYVDVHRIFALKCVKTLKYGMNSWCEYIFDNKWTKEICWNPVPYCLNRGAQIVKTLLQVPGGWIPQSEVVRTLSDHTAGRQPGSYWREHDDPVNYKGDITQVNLMLQTHRDVVSWLSNLMSNRL